MSLLKPQFILRLSLAITYFYSGWSLLTSPTSWTQFVPFWLKEQLMNFNFPVAVFVQVQGAVEMLLALIFILWFMPRNLVCYAALFSALEMAFILIFTGIDLTTFRDIGLLGLSLGIFLIYRERP